MVSASEIMDEKTLRAWLEGRPQTDSVAIALRAALRVFPIWAAAMDERWAQELDLTSLTVLRCALAVGVYIGETTLTVNQAAHATADVTDVAVALATDFADATRAAPATRAAAASAAARAATTAATAAHATDAAALWRGLREDAIALETDVDCRILPLWSDAPPKWFEALENSFLGLWDREPDTWDFWRRWWIGARDGKPMDWELQKRIALIPHGEWLRNDPAHVATLIREIEAEFARERTDNAERIEVNPETGRLRLVPTSALPADISTLTRSNITAALDLFDAQPQDQYSALDPARARLRNALEQTPDMPVVLFDACASAVRITMDRASTRSIPAPE